MDLAVLVRECVISLSVTLRSISLPRADQTRTKASNPNGCARSDPHSRQPHAMSVQGDVRVPPRCTWYRLLGQSCPTNLPFESVWLPSTVIGSYRLGLPRLPLRLAKQ